MNLTTEHAESLLLLIADLTSQRDAANAAYQKLNREWDQHEEQTRVARQREQDAADRADKIAPLVDVLNAWSGLTWRWLGGRVAGSTMKSGTHLQVEWEATPGGWQALLLRVVDGRDPSSDAVVRVLSAGGSTRLEALIQLVMCGPLKVSNEAST